MPIFQNHKEESSWISNADLMSVLMMIFLFISVVYMRSVGIEKERIEAVAVTYKKTQSAIAHDLKQEFSKDLQTWNALVDTNTLSIRFENPEILFKVGSAEINDHFKSILDDFFPRFLQILTDPKYKNNIAEIRIEGHTSSEWVGESSSHQSYFNNMELSQNRTRNVLVYVLSKINNEALFDWTRGNLTANGLSSSKPIVDANQMENKECSRRVEFRVQTNAEEQIVKILKQVN